MIYINSPLYLKTVKMSGIKINIITLVNIIMLKVIYRANLNEWSLFIVSGMGKIY